MKKLLALVLILSGSSAFAAGRGYGDAGCGLGSLVFGDDNRVFQQVIAHTLNGTGVQTFGISSGTSNCDDHGATKGAQAVPAFIEMNSIALAKDASRGEGETLANLASLMGCSSSNLGPALQKNYKPVFVDSKMDPAQIEAGINQVITRNQMACGS